MILLELKAIGINILFGIFFSITINFISLLFTKNKPILSNAIYFIFTICCGILYIIYIDKIFIKFNLYFVVFIVLGFYIGSTSSKFNIDKQLKLFKYLMKFFLNTFNKILKISINYNLWNSIIISFKKRKNKL